MLDYDNSAFYYFAITLLSIYILPGTYYAVTGLFSALFGTGDAGTKARTEEEKEKAQKLKKRTTGFSQLSKPGYLLNLFFLVIAWAILIYLVLLVKNDGEVSRFDPFLILGIEQDSPLAEIKKAYRKLSLKYHPDKNIGDKLAEEMFMKIAKAYEALTDETSKENYKKYGNPDGKQSLEVSIGLPKLLLENPKVVLVLYLIVMVVLIPVAVGVWYTNSKKFGEKDILYDTYAAFYQLVKESDKVQNFSEVLASSAEYRALHSKPQYSSEEEQGYNKLYSKMKEDKLMLKPRFEKPLIMHGNLLLHAHLHRLHNSLSPTLSQDLDTMLTKAPELIEGLIEICYQKKWFQTTANAIRYSQAVVQAMWVDKHPLFQLPHMTEAISNDIQSKICKSGGVSPETQDKEGPVGERILGEFLRYPDDKKPGISSLSEKQKKDLFAVCKIIPNLKIETRLFVEDDEETNFFEDVDREREAEKQKNAKKSSNKKSGSIALADEKPLPRGDQIYEQDLVTLRLTFTRENIPAEPGSEKKKKTLSAKNKKKGKAVTPAVHAPLFPRTLNEGWWVILTDKKACNDSTHGHSHGQEVTIHAIERVSDQTREFVHEVKFMAPPKAGDYEMEVHVFSDCYLGLDRSLPFSFTVRPASELPAYKPHQEDLDLDNEPTLFEQVMAANHEDDSSDDEDEEEEGEEEDGEGEENDNKGEDGEEEEEEDE